MHVSETAFEVKLDKVLETVNQLITQTSEIMTIPDAARFLRRKESTIRSWVAARQVPFSKRNGTIYFLRDDLLAWIKKGRIKTQIEQISEVFTSEANSLKSPRNRKLRRSTK